MLHRGLRWESGMSGLPRIFGVLFVRSRCRGVIKKRNPWWPTSQRLVGLTTPQPSHLECQLGEAERVRHRQEADAESNLPVWWSRETQINLKHTQTESSYIIKCWLSPNTAGFILHSFVYSTKLFYHIPYASTAEGNVKRTWIRR